MSEQNHTVLVPQDLSDQSVSARLLRLPEVMTMTGIKARFTLYDIPPAFGGFFTPAFYARDGVSRTCLPRSYYYGNLIMGLNFLTSPNI